MDREGEHGPVSKEEFSALIRSGRVNLFHRIKTSGGGAHRPFEVRDPEA